MTILLGWRSASIRDKTVQNHQIGNFLRFLRLIPHILLVNLS